MNTIYDVMILGAGPAGLTAALYAGRSGLNTLLLEQGQDGGQIALTDEIENYPGQLEGESGAALIARMSAQAERFGAVRAFSPTRACQAPPSAGPDSPSCSGWPGRGRWI